MKIALAYPKMHTVENFGPKTCVAFEKYDGTNLHWVWHKDKGFYAFGTRRDRYDYTPDGIREFIYSHRFLKDAPEIFKDSYQFLENHIKPYDYEPTDEDSGNVVLFTEFLGDRSFAGTHKHDDQKRLILFDVKNDWGFAGPERFIEDYGKFNVNGFHIARSIYNGKYSGQLVEDIRNGKYAVNEGAVIKGVYYGTVCMAKVKTNAYLDKLKETFKDSWKNYWE